MNSLHACGVAMGVALAFGLSGCQGSDSGYKTAQELQKEKPKSEVASHDEHDGHEHGDGHGAHAHDEDHHHDAPHGGGIVMLGDHVAHFEIVVDPAAGKITAYVLDGNAEKPLAIAQKEISATVTPEQEGDKPTGGPFEVKLLADESADPKGSVFTAESDRLKGIGHFDFKIAQIMVNETDFKDKTIHFEPAEPKSDAKSE